MRRALLPACLLAAAACSSQPDLARPDAPQRNVVERPDGVVPDGLAEQRAALDAQRQEIRARTDAANVQVGRASPPTSNTPWYERAANTAFGLIDALAPLVGWLR